MEDDSLRPLPALPPASPAAGTPGELSLQRLRCSDNPSDPELGPTTSLPGDDDRATGGNPAAGPGRCAPPSIADWILQYVDGLGGGALEADGSDERD